METTQHGWISARAACKILNCGRSALHRYEHTNKLIQSWPVRTPYYSRQYLRCDIEGLLTNPAYLKIRIPSRGNRYNKD